MSTQGSVKLTIANFLSRIEKEGKLEASVVEAIKSLANSGRLSDQSGVREALQKGGPVVDQAKSPDSSSGPRSS